MQPGRLCYVRSPANLTEWTPLTTLTNTFGTVQFADGAGTNLPLRFYRAVTPP